MAVVEVFSTRGVEYAMLTICLFLAAGALIGLLLALVNGAGHFAVLAFPISLLIVTLPVFSFFFLRQKRAELANPALKLDPSKRRLTQFTQIVAFAICLFSVIAFVFLIFSKVSGQGGLSIVKGLLNLVIVLAVAGGILAYYWHDEHQRSGQ
jgi:mannose/fructose/N-acetylgalactosamine-specific phosphotransferase system component IIC